MGKGIRLLTSLTILLVVVVSSIAVFTAPAMSRTADSAISGAASTAMTWPEQPPKWWPGNCTLPEEPPVWWPDKWTWPPQMPGNCTLPENPAWWPDDWKWPPLLQGDADENGDVSMGDVTKVERTILGIDLPRHSADANGAGLVNMGDVPRIERLILRID